MENQKPVLITTQHRGVFFGMVANDADLTPKTLTDIKQARMAIYFGTEKGVQQLADTGPTKDSRISAPSDIEVLHDVTGVFTVTPEAMDKWISQ